MPIWKASMDYDRSDRSRPRAVRWTVELVILALIVVGSYVILTSWFRADGAEPTAPPAAAAPMADPGTDAVRAARASPPS
ncbi:hypothetical protein [Nocardioides bruguierae]|uniref:Uncharacterized protein n=1 Tax=Nocardioides bruguierae TaxID=2945102 RepID=A0A9X2DE43_9ACTN|nr:hypothetical protein [Nocardioides bruguierae]MCM0622739.1 hypothetical protein [Nocardioides bruguierae]